MMKKTNHKYTVSQSVSVGFERSQVISPFCCFFFFLGSAVPAVSLQLRLREFKGLPASVPGFNAAPLSGSHCKHTQGAGLVLQTQDTVGNSFQMAGEPHSNVLNVPVKDRDKRVCQRSSTWTHTLGPIPALFIHMLPACEALKRSKTCSMC